MVLWDCCFLGEAVAAAVAAEGGGKTQVCKLHIHNNCDNNCVCFMLPLISRRNRLSSILNLDKLNTT